MFCFTDDLFENDNFSIITLPHPAHGEHTKYCLDDVNKKIYEIVSFSEPYRSWFIGDTVKSEGSTMMVTPVNPLFLGTLKLLNYSLKILPTLGIVLYTGSVYF